MCKGVHSVPPMVVMPRCMPRCLATGPGLDGLLRDCEIRRGAGPSNHSPACAERHQAPGSVTTSGLALRRAPLRHWAARELLSISAAFLHDAQHAEHAQLPPSPDGRGQAKPKSHPRTWLPPTARRVKPSGRWINPQPASLGPGHEWWRRRRHLKQGRRRHLRNNPPAAALAPWRPSHPRRPRSAHVPRRVSRR